MKSKTVNQPKTNYRKLVEGVIEQANQDESSFNKRFVRGLADAGLRLNALKLNGKEYGPKGSILAPVPQIGQSEEYQYPSFIVFK